MPVEFDWSLLKDIGIGGVSALALFLFYKAFIFFIGQWKESTDAINRNTDTHENMKEVFQAFHEDHKKFQEEAIGIMSDTNKTVRKIDKKVNDLHERYGGDN